MKVTGVRYVPDRRKFTSEDYAEEAKSKKPHYEFKELEAIVINWIKEQK